MWSLRIFQSSQKLNSHSHGIAQTLASYGTVKFPYHDNAKVGLWEPNCAVTWKQAAQFTSKQFSHLNCQNWLNRPNTTCTVIWHVYSDTKFTKNRSLFDSISTQTDFRTMVFGTLREQMDSLVLRYLKYSAFTHMGRKYLTIMTQNDETG